VKSEKLRQQALDLIYKFFVNSNDFNGIPLRDISEKLSIEYEDSIDLIKQLITDGSVFLQSSTNPHIIGRLNNIPIETQIKIIDDAKSTEVKHEPIGNIVISVEQTEFPICLYPSPSYLTQNRSFDEFSGAKFTTLLANAEPQLSFRFFETDVLEKYSNDPRFNFKFTDFYGDIYCAYDEDGNPLLREEDQVFLKSFGLGFDKDDNRLICVLLRDLSDLSPEHQTHWSSKEIPVKECKVLKEYAENVIEGCWITTRSIFSAFIGEINAIYALTKNIYNKPLFKKEYSGENWPQNFTFFFSPTAKNYYDFVNLLDKYLSENLEKNFFTDTIEPFELKDIGDGLVERINKGSLKLLEEWLNKSIKFQDDNAVSALMKPLKKVRKERQKPAHAIITNTYDVKFIDKQKSLIEECYHTLYNLRKLFQSHPKCKGIEIPDWLDAGNIKVY
jgi:hypothetical protein